MFNNDILVGDIGKNEVKGTIFEDLYSEYEKYLQEEDGTLTFFEWKRTFCMTV